MKFEQKDNTLTIFLEGRVDSTNANQIENDLFSIKDANSYENLALDLDDLIYISSAGLRIILKLLKTEKSLKIINASSEVYEIFEMTGFSEMADISKAYRKVSLDNCEVIGKGANGKVYRIDPETIVKVYINEDSLPDIKRERDLARKAFVLGIPTAIPYDIIKTSEGYGSVFELLNSEPFSKLIKSDPDNKEKYVSLSVDLLKKLHSTTVKETDMPSMKELAIKWGMFMKDYLDESRYNKLIKMINDIPDSLTMLHGDYHFKNVMMQNDEPLLIDMDTICYGNNIFEFASMYNAYIGFSDYNEGQSECFLSLPSDIVQYIYYRSLELYFDTTDRAFIDNVTKKAMVLGYVRIIRRNIRRGCLLDNRKEMVYEYIEALKKLIDEIDTLII